MAEAKGHRRSYIRTDDRFNGEGVPSKHSIGSSKMISDYIKSGGAKCDVTPNIRLSVSKCKGAQRHLNSPITAQKNRGQSESSVSAIKVKAINKRDGKRAIIDDETSAPATGRA